MIADKKNGIVFPAPSGKPNPTFEVRMLLYAISIVLLSIGIYSTYQRRIHTYQEFKNARFYMDTYIEIIVLSNNKDSAEKAMDKAFNVFAKLDKKFNYNDPESLLGELNRNMDERRDINNNREKNTNGWIQVETALEDKELAMLIHKGIEFSKMTGGAFDPTLGAVKDLYPFGAKNPSPPPREAIRKTLEISGYQKLNLSGNGLRKPKGMKIDFGGILKGYAVDEAIDVLKKEGIENALVNAGGNIRVMGKNIKNESWKIGVENPRAPGKIMAVISLDNKAVATSGDYQRYFFFDKVRYHHILDPKTGEPARKAISATVITPDGITSDALSTAVFVMGKRKGIEFLEKHKLDGIIVDENGVEITKELKEKIDLK